MEVEGFFSSHKSNNINLEQWDDAGITSQESVDDPHASNTKDSFYYQLMNFAEEVALQSKSASPGLPWSYNVDENAPSTSVKNMAVIDDIYRAAGMKPRQTKSSPPAPYDHIGLSKL